MIRIIGFGFFAVITICLSFFSFFLLLLKSMKRMFLLLQQEFGKPYPSHGAVYEENDKQGYEYANDVGQQQDPFPAGAAWIVKNLFGHAGCAFPS